MFQNDAIEQPIGEGNRHVLWYSVLNPNLLLNCWSNLVTQTRCVIGFQKTFFLYMHLV